MRGGEHRGTGADAFILEISGKALVKPRKEKLAHRPHDFGKMLRCFPVNVVFNVNILIHQSTERAGRSDENFRLLLGLNQNIKADKIVYYAYFDGNSLSVRQNVKNLQGFYSPKANYVLMLTDEYANYESRNNLKTIADNEGKEVEVDEVLYKILQDAYTKSKEEKNYSLLG